MMWGETELSATRQIARQRTGTRRDNESAEEYEARVQENMPRANRVPMGSQDQANVENERKIRHEREDRMRTTH